MGFCLLGFKVILTFFCHFSGRSFFFFTQKVPTVWHATWKTGRQRGHSPNIPSVYHTVCTIHNGRYTYHVYVLHNIVCCALISCSRIIKTRRTRADTLLDTGTIISNAESSVEGGGGVTNLNLNPVPGGGGGGGGRKGSTPRTLSQQEEERQRQQLAAAFHDVGEEMGGRTGDAPDQRQLEKKINRFFSLSLSLLSSVLSCRHYAIQPQLIQFSTPILARLAMVGRLCRYFLKYK